MVIIGNDGRTTGNVHNLNYAEKIVKEVSKW